MKPISTKVYKVVMPINGRLRSALTNTHPSKANLTYSLRRVTVPKIGKIFAFKTLGQARNFLARDKQLQLWEAEATGVTMAKSRAFLISNRAWIYIKAYWEARERNEKDDFRLQPIRGTVFCDSLKLTKRID